MKPNSVSAKAMLGGSRDDVFLVPSSIVPLLSTPFALILTRLASLSMVKE